MDDRLINFDRGGSCVSSQKVEDSIWNKPKLSFVSNFSTRTFYYHMWTRYRDEDYTPKLMETIQISRPGDFDKYYQLILDFDTENGKYGIEHYKYISDAIPGLPRGVSYELYSAVVNILLSNRFFEYLHCLPKELIGKDVFDLFDTVTLYIGHTQVETLTSDYLRFYNLCFKKGKEDPRWKFHYMKNAPDKPVTIGVVLDLPFAMLEDDNIIPQICLAYHDVRAEIKKKADVCSLLYFGIRQDTVNVSSEERRWMARNQHYYPLAIASVKTVQEDGVIDLSENVRYIAFHKDCMTDLTVTLVSDSYEQYLDKYRMQIDNFERYGLERSEDYCIIPFTVDLTTTKCKGSYNFRATYNVKLKGLKVGSQIFISHYKLGRTYHGMFILEELNINTLT